jgi:hemin uptake protein HemP
MNPDQPEAESDTMQTGTSISSRNPVAPGTRSFPPGAIPTEFLFRGTQEILINHNGEHYRLRITKNGKLILTK